MTDDLRAAKARELCYLTEEELGAHCSAILEEVSRLALERMRDLRERG